MIMEKEQIKGLMLKHLREGFNLFNENHEVNVCVLELKNICVGYRSNMERINDVRGNTNFDIQLVDDVCYILSIELEKNKRGQGIGWSLYEVIHNFAREFGSKKVRQTPSGWTGQGKTRREYLLNRGYSSFGNYELELIL